MEELKKKVDEQYEYDVCAENAMKTHKLVCRKVRGNYQYYVDGKYKSKKQELEKIKKIAQVEYRGKLLVLLEKKSNSIRKVERFDALISDLYHRLPEGKKVLFEPDVMLIDKVIAEFEQSAYEGLGFAEDDRTEFFTNKGERVRSKSEKIIADELARYDIPYKYEKPLTLLIDGKIIDFYPDFTVICRSTGKVMYLEHLGMMDNTQYYNNVLNKLDAYEKNDLLIGRDIILLHESAYRPLSTRAISDYIHEFLL